MTDKSNQKRTLLDTLPEDDEGDQISFEQNENQYQIQNDNWYQPEDDNDQDQIFYEDQEEIQRIQEVYPSEYQEHQNFLSYDSRLTFENEIRKQQIQYQTTQNSLREQNVTDDNSKNFNKRYALQRECITNSPDIQNKPQPITEEPSEDSIGKSFIDEQLVPRRIGLGEKKSPSKLSLIGTLFTPNILKEIQMLNEMRLFTEQGRQSPYPDEIENGQYKQLAQIQVQPLNFQQTRTYHTFQTQQSSQDDQKSINSQEQFSQQHSTLKINILREITLNLQNDEEQQSQIYDKNSEPRINPILLSKQPEILDFIMTLGKELIGKQALTKTMKEKILQKNKEIQFLLKKNRVVNKSVQIIGTNRSYNQDDEQIVPAQKAFTKLSHFFIPAFIQSLNLDCLNHDVWFRIFSTISVMFAIGYEDFKLINNKIPKITKDSIILLLKNPSNMCSSIKNIQKSLLQKPLQKDVFFEFQKQFILLDKIVETNVANELKDENVFLMLKMIYSAKYYCDCLGDLDKLQFIQDPTPLLNYDINKLYEEHIWQPKGTRYGTAKNSDELRQAEMKKIYEKYGIDFMSWELNLKIQEDEIKQVKRAEKELEWKERKNQKQILQLQSQKENALELEANQERQFLISQATKEQEHQKKVVEKQQKHQESTQLIKRLKKGKIEKEKEIILHERQKLEEQKKFESESQTMKQRNKKIQQEEFKINIQDKKEKIQQQKVIDLEKEDEEKVWRRAQEMLQRQKKLLKQKEDILKRISVFEKSKVI